jgi:hypothetical protein
LLTIPQRLAQNNVDAAAQSTEQKDIEENAVPVLAS